MLGLETMSPDAWGYYTEQVAQGAEDYYAGHGEEPGVWMGTGAEAIGLSGRVDREQLRLLFGEARDPATGEPLGAPFRGDHPVAGFAVSLSAPKSVSVLWALGGDETAAQVRAAHDAAVQATVACLE